MARYSVRITTLIVLIVLAPFLANAEDKHSAINLAFSQKTNE